jgi:hypothetical protein
MARHAKIVLSDEEREVSRAGPDAQVQSLALRGPDSIQICGAPSPLTVSRFSLTRSTLAARPRQQAEQ